MKQLSFFSNLNCIWICQTVFKKALMAVVKQKRKTIVAQHLLIVHVALINYRNKFLSKQVTIVFLAQRGSSSLLRKPKEPLLQLFHYLTFPFLKIFSNKRDRRLRVLNNHITTARIKCGEQS